MTTDVSILNEITFAYSFSALFLALLIPASEISLSLTPLIALASSVLATFLLVVQPLQRFFKNWAMRRLPPNFRCSAVPGPTGGHAELPQVNITPISRQAVNSNTITKEVSVLSGMAYYLVILLMIAFVIPKQAVPIAQALKIDPQIPVYAPLLIALAGILTLPIIFRRWILLPTLVYLTSIYLLQVEGLMARIQNFDAFGSAILGNDWVTARYWALSAHHAGLFDPAPREIVY